MVLNAFKITLLFNCSEPLGEGGTAQVFKALDYKKKQQVAVKVVTNPDPDQRTRMIREYEFLSLVKHPNLIEVYDYFEEDDRLFMVLEFIDGFSMGAILRQRTTPISLPVQLAIANKLSRVVEMLNTAWILHRDIKPDNIMLNFDKGTVKLLDLGIGKDLARNESLLTMDASVLGTLDYLSPEQANGGFSERSDIFSLGVSLYQFFLWEPHSPFKDDNSFNTLLKIGTYHPPSIYEKISKQRQTRKRVWRPKEREAYLALSRLIHRAMQKAPQKRWESACKMADKFIAIQDKFLSINFYRRSVHYRHMLNVCKEIDSDTLFTLIQLRAKASHTEIQQLQSRRIKNTAVFIIITAILTSTFLFIYKTKHHLPVPSEAIKKTAVKQSIIERSEFLFLSGRRYFFGEGCPKDYWKAQEFYRQAAEMGNIEAMCDLGIMYYEGLGGPRNYRQAAIWLEKASKAGNYWATAVLGTMYEHGHFFKENCKQAQKLYRKAIAGGNNMGMYRLALLYLKGKGLPRNESKAVEWLLKASEKGSYEAMERLGDLYILGQGVKPDLELSLKWYQKSAKYPNPAAMIKLGSLYFQEKSDYKKALTWFRKAAEFGDVTAFRFMGIMYFNGKGVAVNYEKAMKWLLQAAEKGDTIAAKMVANMYVKNFGGKKYRDAARRWYELLK